MKIYIRVRRAVFDYTNMAFEYSHLDRWTDIRDRRIV